MHNVIKKLGLPTFLGGGLATFGGGGRGRYFRDLLEATKF